MIQKTCPECEFIETDDLIFLRRLWRKFITGIHLNLQAKNKIRVFRSLSQNLSQSCLELLDELGFQKNISLESLLCSASITDPDRSSREKSVIAEYTQKIYFLPRSRLGCTPVFARRVKGVNSLLSTLCMGFLLEKLNITAWLLTRAGRLVLAAELTNGEYWFIDPYEGICGKFQEICSQRKTYGRDITVEGWCNKKKKKVSVQRHLVKFSRGAVFTEFAQVYFWLLPLLDTLTPSRLRENAVLSRKKFTHIVIQKKCLKEGLTRLAHIFSETALVLLDPNQGFDFFKIHVHQLFEKILEDFLPESRDIPKTKNKFFEEIEKGNLDIFQTIVSGSACPPNTDGEIQSFIEKLLPAMVKAGYKLWLFLPDPMTEALLYRSLLDTVNKN